MTALVLCLAWSFGLSAVLDRRFSRRALQRADQGPRATARMVRWRQARWFALWFVVWILGISLAKEDATNHEAAVVVIPMILAYGPIALRLAAGRAWDLVEFGADEETARAVFRAGKPWAYVGGWFCIIAIVYTFGL